MVDLRPPEAGTKRRKPSTPHSFRCEDRVWQDARARAIKEDVPMNYVIEQFIRGYADGELNLPTFKANYSSE